MYNTIVNRSDTANPPLLAAKFFQPLLNPNQVARPHLVQRLNEGLASGRPVTLVSAPAGYGKSALIAEWARQTRLPVTWLSLDEADDDPLHFFIYLIAALQKVASAIGETLRGRGFSVNVKPAKENPSLDGYQAVIMGSAIRMGSWLPEAVDFIKNNQGALNNMPVALFTVHILNLGDDEQSRASRLAYLDIVRPLLKPVDEIFFAGEINPAKLSFVDRLMAKMVKSPIRDLRDWDKIRGWAHATLS